MGPTCKWVMCLNMYMAIVEYVHEYSTEIYLFGQVWDLESGKRLVTLRNHEDGVTCLQFNDSIIVSGSYDKTVKLFDFSSI